MRAKTGGNPDGRWKQQCNEEKEDTKRISIKTYRSPDTQRNTNKTKKQSLNTVDVTH